MGGRVWVESTAGLGSTFYFTIQAAAAPVFLRSPTPLNTMPAQLANKRILVVDDNETNRKILKLQIESWGMSPYLYANAREALGVLEQGEKFDLALLDMQMPEMDGIMLASKIRQYYSAEELPLVLLTSLEQREVASNQNVFKTILTKPLKAVQLYQAIMAILVDEAIQLSTTSVSGESYARKLVDRFPLQILIAEDFPINQKLAVRLLEQMGYQVEVVSNGREVLAVLARQAYDLVLMDVQMPEMDGLAATEQIIQNWPPDKRPYIIAMTANAMQGDQEKYLAAGMQDYVSKPVRANELLSAVERAGNYILQRNQAVTTELTPQKIAVLDPVALAKFRQFDQYSSQRFLREISKAFQSDVPPLLAKLENALQKRDMEHVTQAIHALKGGSQNIGAFRLAEVCQELETHLQNELFANTGGLLNELRVEYEQVCQALAVELEAGSLWNGEFKSVVRPKII